MPKLKSLMLFSAAAMLSAQEPHGFKIDGEMFPKVKKKGQ